MGNDIVRVGIVGVGYWGPNLVRTFDGLEGCAVALVCDRRPGRLQYIHERFPHIPLSTRYDDMLEDRSIGAVVVATPVATHRYLAVRAIHAGKHVFVEKPLTDRVEDALALAQEAESAGRVLAVGHVFVAHPAIARLRHEIRAGTLGRLCYVQSTRINLGPPSSEVDVVWDLAVHDVSILLSLIREEPVEVAAIGARYLHPSLADVAFLTVRFSTGLLAHLHVSWLSPLKVRRFFVAGSRGSATFDDLATGGKLILSDAGQDTRVGADDAESRELLYRPGEITIPDLPAILPLTAECQQFLEAIRTGTPPSSDGWAGVAVVRVLEAAERSLAAATPAASPVPVPVGR